MRDFHPLRVLDVRKEIGGQAKTVMFDVPSELQNVFEWQPGQHLTVRFKIDGEEVRRSYSVSSSPYSGEPLRITVKRVKGGLVSNYINDHIETGLTIDVMPPFGGFFLQPGEKLRRTHYFFGAGSGITPLFSMLNSVLCAEPYSVAYLMYGNKNSKTILFRETLDRLLEQYPDRFNVSHVLSSPSMWSSFSYWRKGLIDKQTIEAQIIEYPPYAQDVQYYICGPGGMNKAVKSALMSLDVPTSRIHMESYGGAVEVDDSIKGIAAKAQIVLDGESHSVEIGPGQTVLDAIRAAGLNPPFSCESGVCGACRAKLTNGRVEMRARMALEDDEVDRGSILTCQSLATTPDIGLTYE